MSLLWMDYDSEFHNLIDVTCQLESESCPQYFSTLSDAAWKSYYRDTRYNVDFLYTSYNVARGDLYQPDLTEVLTGLLNKYELEPSDLHLEILERAYVHDSDNMLHILSELKSQGFYIEVDDFGTGESSLAMGCHLAQGYLYGKT